MLVHKPLNYLDTKIEPKILGIHLWKPEKRGFWLIDIKIFCIVSSQDLRKKQTNIIEPFLKSWNNSAVLDMQ